MEGKQVGAEYLAKCVVTCACNAEAMRVIRHVCPELHDLITGCVPDHCLSSPATA